MHKAIFVLVPSFSNSDWLNDKNKLTVMGVPFTPANVRFKYLAYQDKKNKRLKY